MSPKATETTPEEATAMATPQNIERRKTVLIDRDFQLSFIGRLGGFLLFYLLLFLVIAIVAPVVFTFLGDPPEWALMETAFRVEVLMRLILAPLVCTFLCLFAHGVLETFRIAGPNFRFKAVMRDLSRLRVPRGVQVRKSDLLQDTAAEFHQALVVLHDQIAAVRGETKTAMAKARQALGPATGEAGQEALAALAKLEHEVGAFELLACAPNYGPSANGPGDKAIEPMVEPMAVRRPPVGAKSDH